MIHMKILHAILLLLFSFSLLLQQSYALSPEDPIVVTWTPSNPELAEEITVYAETELNASSIVLQVCYGDICLLPTQMEKVGEGEYRDSFSINEDEPVEVELHFEIMYDSTSTWHNSTVFDVGKTENGTPGFIVIGCICAGAIAAFMMRKKRS